MTRFFRLICDSNHFRTVVRGSDLPIDWVNQFDGKRFLEHWQIPVMSWYQDQGDDPDAAMKVGDFCQFSAHLPVINKKACLALGELIQDRAEFLPVIIDGDDSYGLLNVTCVLPALDEEKATYSIFEGGRIMHISHHAFIEDMLDGVDMFRLTDYEISGVYVSEDFRDMVVKSQLSGLLWEELV